VQFPRQLGATNLTYILQVSTNLANWSAVCPAAGTNPPTGPGLISESGTAYQRQVSTRDLVAVEKSPSARFLRFTLSWKE
jgi:hypothetical protein